MSIDAIFAAICRERLHQDQKYGLVTGNAGHSLPGWCLVVEKELAEAKEAATGRGLREKKGRHTTRSELVQIAAVCIAALEQHGLEEEV